jgi:sugar diacid utilization regulator
MGDGGLRSGPLDEFLRRLITADSVAAATQAAVDAARARLSTDVSWAGVVRGDMLRMAAHSGLRTSEMPATWCLGVGEGVGGRVAKEGRTIAVRDYRHDPRRVPVMKRLIDDEGIRGGACAPLVNGSEVLGVLYAAQRAPRDWTADDVRSLSDIARDTGSAIGVIRQRERERARARKAEELAASATRSLEVLRAAATSLVQSRDFGAGLAALAHHLRMDVVLVDPVGDLLRHVSAGTEPARQVQLEVSVGEQPLGFLRIVGDRELTDAEHELAMMCADLVALQLLRERAALQTELRVHSEFLDDLLQGRLTERHTTLVRAALLGVDLRSPQYVACIGLPARSDTERIARSAVSDSPAWPAVTRQVLISVEREIRKHLPGSIVLPRLGDLVCLLPAGDPDQVHLVLRHVIGEPVAQSDCLVAGLGRVCLQLEDYADSYAVASLALDLARHRRQAGVFLTSADLGLYGLLGRLPTRQSLKSVVEQALGPIIDADATGGTEYVKTLDAFLASDRHLEHAASSLHVHPNTVRYRLAKVQEALGVNLRDVDDRFQLELALRVRAALAQT